MEMSFASLLIAVLMMITKINSDSNESNSFFSIVIATTLYKFDLYSPAHTLQLLKSFRLSNSQNHIKFEICQFEGDNLLSSNELQEFSKLGGTIHLIKSFIKKSKIEEEHKLRNLICLSRIGKKNLQSKNLTHVLYLDSSIFISNNIFSVLKNYQNTSYACLPGNSLHNFCSSLIYLMNIQESHLLENIILNYIDNDFSEMSFNEILYHFFRNFESNSAFDFFPDNILLRTSVDWYHGNTVPMLTLDNIDTTGKREELLCNHQQSCRDDIPCHCHVSVVQPYHIRSLVILEKIIEPMIFHNQTNCRILQGCQSISSTSTSQNINDDTSSPSTSSSSSTSTMTTSTTTFTDNISNTNLDTINSPEVVVDNRRRVFDVFPIFDEMTMLKVRLALLDSKVDKFIIIEAKQTYTGLSKPLYFLEQKHSLSDHYLSKIIHIVIDLPHNNCKNREEAWINERYQRDFLSYLIFNDQSKDTSNINLQVDLQLQPDDIFLITDLDELIRPSAIDTLLQLTSKEADFPDTTRYYKLGMSFFVYNFTSPMGDFITTHPFAMTYRHLKRVYFQTKDWNGFSSSIRTGDHGASDPFWNVIARAGWHCSNFKSVPRIREKLEASAHTEFNTATVKDSVAERVRAGRPTEFVMDATSHAYSVGNKFLEQKARKLYTYEEKDLEFLHLRKLWHSLATVDDIPVAGGGTVIDTELSKENNSNGNDKIKRKGTKKNKTKATKKNKTKATKQPTTTTTTTRKNNPTQCDISNSNNKDKSCQDNVKDTLGGTEVDDEEDIISNSNSQSGKKSQASNPKKGKKKKGTQHKKRKAE